MVTLLFVLKPVAGVPKRRDSVRGPEGAVFKVGGRGSTRLNEQERAATNQSYLGSSRLWSWGIPDQIPTAAMWRHVTYSSHAHAWSCKLF
jgi:hypothetical protein